MRPETRYARTSDRTRVAYQVSGDGPIDIVLLRAWTSTLESEWEARAREREVSPTLSSGPAGEFRPDRR